MSPAADPSRTTQRDAGVPAPILLRSGLIAAFAALFANLLVYAIATRSGAGLGVHSGGAFVVLSPAVIGVMSVVPVLLGAALTMMVGRRSSGAVAVLGLVGLGIGVVTTVLPLIMGLGAAAKASLALMHMLTGLIWWIVIGGTARRGR